jgi:hypothetical protein
VPHEQTLAVKRLEPLPGSGARHDDEVEREPEQTENQQLKHLASEIPVLAPPELVEVESSDAAGKSKTGAVDALSLLSSHEC